MSKSGIKDIMLKLENVEPSIRKYTYVYFVAEFNGRLFIMPSFKGYNEPIFLKISRTNESVVKSFGPLQLIERIIGLIESDTRLVDTVVEIELICNR